MAKPSVKPISRPVDNVREVAIRVRDIQVSFGGNKVLGGRVVLPALNAHDAQSFEDIGIRRRQRQRAIQNMQRIAMTPLLFERARQRHRLGYGQRLKIGRIAHEMRRRSQIARSYMR